METIEPDYAGDRCVGCEFLEANLSTREEVNEICPRVLGEVECIIKPI